MTYLRSPRLPLNVQRDLSMYHEGFINLKRFRCAGDGVTDDTDRFGEAVAAAIAANKPLFIPAPRAFYKITSTITGDGPCVIFGEDRDNTIVQMTTSGDVLFNWTGDGLELYNLTLKGDGFTAGSASTVDQNELLVDMYGADSDNYLTRFRSDNVRFQNCGGWGVRLQFVNDFQCTNCIFEELGYAGFMTLSCSDGNVSDNYIDNVWSTHANQYGIAFTRSSSTSLSDHPRSQRIVCRGNYIQNIPKWEALDTHSGAQIVFDGNTIYNTNIGIAVGDSNVAAETSPWGIVVTNNTMYSGVTDGSRRQGIIFHGDDNGQGTPRAVCSGVISGNHVEYYGNSDGASEGGIYVYCTKGLTITGNSCILCSPSGIVLDFDNYGINISGNSVIDPWSDQNNYAYGVQVLLGYNQGIIQGNTFQAYSLSAPSPGAVLEYGVFVESGVNTNLDLAIGSNHCHGHATGVYNFDDNDTAITHQGSIFQTHTGRTRNYKTVTNTNVTLDLTYEWVSVQASTQAVTVTLPSTVPAAGTVFYIHHRSGTLGTWGVTIGRNGNLINGAASDHSFATDQDLVIVTSDGSGWHTHTVPQ